MVRGRYVMAAYTAFFLSQFHFVLFDLRPTFLSPKSILATAFSKGPSSHNVTLLYAQRMIENHWDVFRYNFCQPLRMRM